MAHTLYLIYYRFVCRLNNVRNDHSFIWAIDVVVLSYVAYFVIVEKPEYEVKLYINLIFPTDFS